MRVHFHAAKTEHPCVRAAQSWACFYGLCLNPLSQRIRSHRRYLARPLSAAERLGLLQTCQLLLLRGIVRADELAEIYAALGAQDLGRPRSAWKVTPTA